MKIKDGYIMRKIGTKYYAVSASRAAEGMGMIALNETGAFIWNILKDDTDIDSVYAALAEKYEIPFETAKHDAEEFLAMLKEANALA